MDYFYGQIDNHWKKCDFISNWNVFIYICDYFIYISTQNLSRRLFSLAIPEMERISSNRIHLLEDEGRKNTF